MALAVIDRVLKVDEQKEEALFNMARCFAGLKDVRQMYEALRKLLSVASGYGEKVLNEEVFAPYRAEIMAALRAMKHR